jgi:hypothetical protein
MTERPRKLGLSRSCHGRFAQPDRQRRFGFLAIGGPEVIVRVTADKKGNYRIALPPYDYILDVQWRKPGFVRATAQPFTIVSNHTVRVDMHIDTDHSRSNSMQ